MADIISLIDVKDNDDLWVLEYSNQQKSFNRQLLRKALDNNFQRACTQDDNDWTIVYMGSKKDCFLVSKKIKEYQHKITTNQEKKR